MRTCPQCSSDVGKGPTCPTCGGNLPGPGFSPWPILKLLGCLGVLVVLAAIAIPGYLQSGRASNDRNASASLKTLATAEADFRFNDRDGNQVNDYWTGDVAGLFCIAPGPGHLDPSNAIKLIEISIAGADSDPLQGVTDPPYIPLDPFIRPSPKAGYWYWALRADGSVSPPSPYRQETMGRATAGRYYNTSRFGFVAYPDSLRAGRIVFMINEGNTMIKRRIDAELRPGPRRPPGPLSRPGFTDWPTDAVFLNEWTRLD